MNTTTQTETPPPIIDFEKVKTALYAWPYSPLSDCLEAEGISIEPVISLMELDPSIGMLVNFWLTDRLEGDAPTVS